MEVVGFVVAVGSMAKAGSAALKFASKIRKVAKEAGAVGQSIEQRALTFHTLGKAVELAGISLRHHWPQTGDDSEDSPAIKWMKENDLLESLHIQSYMIRNDLLARGEEICSVVAGWGPRVWREFKTSWNWTKMEQQIMNLQPLMEGIKSTMNLTLDIIILEVAVAKNKNHPSAEHEKEIQLLTTTIVELIDEIRHLRKQCAQIRVPVSAPNGSVRSLSSRVDPLKAMCHLGHSLVESGAVPTEPPESFSFRGAKRSRQYQRRQSKQFQRNNQPDVPAPARHHQVMQPKSSRTPSLGPLPSSPHPQQTESKSPNAGSISPYGYRRDSSSGTPPPGPLPSSPDPQKSEPNGPNTRSASPYEYRREGLYRYRREDDRLQPVNTTGQDQDLFDSEPRSRRRTGSPRQSILTAKEVPTPREGHSADMPDTKRRISRVADFVEPETPPKDQRPTLKPPSHTGSVQAVHGEVNNARARRASRKQRQRSATVTSSDMAARYGNLKPRSTPRSPPKSVEDTRDEMGHNPARNLKSPTAVDKPNGPSGSDAGKPESGGPRKGVIDLRGVADIDGPSRPKRKGSSEARHVGITVQTEPTPPQTPISPTQSSPMFAPPSHSAALSPSTSSAPRSNVIPQPRRQPPSPPGPATSASQTRKSSTKKEIETAYVINPRTQKKTPFQVYIDRKYAVNLITLSYARELGLAIMYHHHSDELPYRGTTIALVGRATLMWSTVPGNTLVDPESVEVPVCGDSTELEHPVIFGKWFVGARKNLNIEEMKEEESLDVERDAGVGGFSQLL